MNIIYENIIKLCDAKGIKPGKMCVDIGISKTIISNLKYEKVKVISIETAQKIADYFDVNVSQIYGEEQKNSTAEDDDGVQELLEQLKNRDEMRMLFKVTKDVTREDILKAVKIIEALRDE